VLREQRKIRAVSFKAATPAASNGDGTNGSEITRALHEKFGVLIHALRDSEKTGSGGP
jgi:hypothetical protein